MDRTAWNLTERLLAAPDGLYLLDETILDLEAAVRRVRAGLVARVVSGRRCWTKGALFREWATSLEFPSYFGRNWHAFDECLGDRDWFEPGRVVVAVTEAERVLAWSTARNLRVFVQVLRKASGSAYRDNTGQEIPGLTVLLMCAPEMSARFSNRLRKAGAELPARLPAPW